MPPSTMQTKADSANHPSLRRPALFLFIAVLATYQLTSRGRLYGGDDLVSVNVARNLLYYGQAKHGHYPEQLKAQKFGLGQALLDLPIAPFYHRVKHADNPGTYFHNLWWMSVLPALLGAIHAVVLLLLLCRLGVGPRAALWTALLFAFATIRWPTAQRLHTDVSIDLFMAIAMYALASARTAWRWHLLAGFATGYLLLLKTDGAVYTACLSILAFALLLQTVPLREGENWVGWLQRHKLLLAAFVLPIASCLALALYYNYWRFGSPWQTGYGSEVATRGFTNSFLGGIYGYIFSPGKSIFVYSPILLLSVLGWVSFYRRCRVWACFCLAVIGVNIALHASWWAWHGDWYWGPRFLVATLTATAIPLAFAIERGLECPWRTWQRRLLRTGALVLLLLSLSVQLLGLVVCSNEYIQHAGYYAPVFTPEVIKTTSNETLMLNFVPEFSPVAGHIWVWRMLHQRDGGWQALYQKPPWQSLNPKWVGTPPERFPFSYNIWWLLAIQVQHQQLGVVLLVAGVLAVSAIVALVRLLRVPLTEQLKPAQTGSH